MTDKDPKEGCLEIDQSCGDDLNAKIGMLTRREVEARILVPVIDALGRQFGNAKVLASVRETIIIKRELTCAKLRLQVSYSYC